jgi:sulfite reductase (ferredoxin)
MQDSKNSRPSRSDSGGRETTSPGAQTPPILSAREEEISHFEGEVRRFRSGGLPNEEFRPFRLVYGVYGQRQPDTQMVRVKLPLGMVTADQMEALARIAGDYTRLGRGHVTTRQNLQFHYVDLERTPDVLRIFHDVGLTTREACGNVVRNVTGCPYAGVCPDELFDVTPYAVAYARNMLRNPVAQGLPRKWKVAFSGCDGDCAGTPFHDLGFVAKARQENGTRRPGFEAVVGGGLATFPLQADVLYDFVTPEDYLTLSEAILRVFAKEGGLPGFLRKNRNKARIKFLIHKIGIEEFRRQVEEELNGDWAKEAKDLDALSSLPAESPGDGDVPTDNGQPPPEGFARWQATNVRRQKQEGYCAVAVTLTLGNITADQFRRLAGFMRVYGNGHARTNQNQNLVLRWVPETALLPLYRDLLEIGLGDSEAGLICDVVSCPGTDTCSLGITSSPGMAAALSQTLREMKERDPLIDQIPIKISGCPNSCGQHHLGAIGLHGAAFKVDGRDVPSYELFLGGGNYIGGGRYGQRVTRIPVKNVPQAVLRILEVYRRERRDREPFLDFLDRFGAKSFEPLLAEFRQVGPVREELDTYIDWGSTVLFKVIRGEGECAV